MVLNKAQGEFYILSMKFVCGFHSHNRYDSKVEDSGLNSSDGNVLSVFRVCNDEFLGQVTQQVKMERDCESLAGGIHWVGVGVGGGVGVLVGEWCGCCGQHRPRETECAKN